MASVDEAFEQFEEKTGNTATKALVAIRRASCTPKPLQQSPYERTRGRLSSLNDNKLDGLGTVTMEYEITYDITVLATNNYIKDTLVDEIYMRILRFPQFIYESGIRDVNDPTKEMKLKGDIRLSNDMFGEFEEAVDTESRGRIYRTTFSVTTLAYAFESINIKATEMIPISLDTDRK